ncbi:unnamed protein product [Adineta steineri]|uniref:Galectin n=2 Tax=Adineta steineri TaxID=433720 RepID=A0A818UTQ3_9BILA|nr:unnamed protein product [Adineta steineri]CAF3705781.1 unnamed protein product [Adineta steineri]
MHFSYGGGMNYGLPVPYTTQITPSLSNGAQIHISGTPTGSRFEINLKSYQNDVVLHVNPRFDDGAIILNNAPQGNWGTEERHALPFHRGARFTMVILATDRSFKIAVNNGHVCEFYHRSPMHLAQQVEIKGDVTLESVQVYPGTGPMGFPPMGGDMAFAPPSFPSAFGGNPGFCPPPPSAQSAFGGGMGYCPPPPSSQSTFGGFTPGFGSPSAPPSMPTTGIPSIQSCRINTGSRIFVQGFIPVGANRFELNLLQGYSDGDDIAFHFNPRFDTRTIVKNHRRNGQWGQEENQPFPHHMPLAPGAPIHLQISCQMDKYTIFMNNHLIAEFYHKIPPGSVMALQYKGDITITSVGQM